MKLKPVSILRTDKPHVLTILPLWSQLEHPESHQVGVPSVEYCKTYGKPGIYQSSRYGSQTNITHLESYE
jgi:hypothetical protein